MCCPPDFGFGHRVVFPMSYLIINIFYWNYYLGAAETVDTTVEK